ncbi:MAG: hypothetical protein EP329_20780 [Deltaproteobacteria bacterium]|nr:MAG: hypothetical protein EP329_20780 [Deltaproteobacteria bacterium]
MNDLSPYTQADRDRWRQLLLKKGKEVADKLERVLAKKDVALEELSLFKNDEPAETKEKRLRRYLDHLMKRLRSLDHPRFGYDPARGAFVAVTELDECPWLDVEP